MKWEINYFRVNLVLKCEKWSAVRDVKKSQSLLICYTYEHHCCDKAATYTSLSCVFLAYRRGMCNFSLTNSITTIFRFLVQPFNLQL